LRKPNTMICGTAPAPRPCARIATSAVPHIAWTQRDQDRLALYPVGRREQARGYGGPGEVTIATQTANGEKRKGDLRQSGHLLPKHPLYQAQPRPTLRLSGF
jgi:hypothetical protein